MVQNIEHLAICSLDTHDGFPRKQLTFEVVREVTKGSLIIASMIDERLLVSAILGGKVIPVISNMILFQPTGEQVSL